MKGKALGAVAVALALQACTPIVRNHGYIPRQSELATLALGSDSRDDVIAKLGRPGLTGLLDDRSIYYVQSRFQQVALLAPEETDREVLALTFTPDGRLGNVERFGLEQGRIVELNPARTAEVFADRGVISRIFGNVGFFDAESLFGSE